MVKNIHTKAITLVITVTLSALSTGAQAQHKRATKVVAKKEHRASHSAGEGKTHHRTHGKSSARNSSVSSGSLGRKKAIGVSITLSRTPTEVKEEHTASPADMTSGYMTLVFQQQKGHLPWPVDSRKVVTNFGYQPYELNPSVYRNNLGINIAIDQDSCVRVVYDGIVDDVMDIGDAKAVMVLHGKYFTIYSDLSTADVVKGQLVKTGDVLGQVGESGQIDFRIYDPNDVWQDPVKWLQRSK